MGLVISEGLRLKSYNTPAAIAGVAPTLDYRFALDRREIEAISLTDKLTYTGATNGTFVNRAGLIERATTDLPRFDHGPVSRQSLGLLVEEARTNLLVSSEEFGTTWATDNATVTVNTISAPDGKITADSLIENSANTAHGIAQSSITVAANTTISAYIYVKPAGRTHCELRVFSGVDGFFSVFNLGSKTFTSAQTGSGLHTFSDVLDVNNGWLRIRITGIPSTTGTSITFRLRLSNGTSTVYTGDGTSDIYLWGAQLEADASPTSYIPTTTTALTRPVDSAVIDGTGVITGTYTLVEKPAGCAVVNGSNIDLVSGFTAERVMVFPAALNAPQITAIRGAM
jgi:hypothetical protein